ncbi:MAG: glycosidase, partial [Thermotogota bacterium]|nr:glycosidase [Thermotogota bacterium]
MVLKLERHPLNPLLSPISRHHWESRFVFNCAVIKR